MARRRVTRREGSDLRAALQPILVLFRWRNADRIQQAVDVIGVNADGYAVGLCSRFHAYYHALARDLLPGLGVSAVEDEGEADRCSHPKGPLGREVHS